MSNELLKIWQQDVADYGDNAHLMWEILSMRGIGNNFTWQSAISNKDLPCDMRRKESAALSFDFDRAADGDAVECKLDDGWFTCTDWYQFRFLYGNNNVRMKYPPKVNHE